MDSSLYRKLNESDLDSRHFLLVFDTETFRTRSHPPARRIGDICGVLSGHLTNDKISDDCSSQVEQFILAYKTDGAKLSARLHGQYAGVIINPTARQVCLVQDSLGVRQLFYSKQGRELVVASNLEYIVAFLGLGDLNERYFSEQFATGTRPRRATPYAAISRLDFGTTLIIEQSRHEEIQPWSPCSHRPEKITLADAASRLRYLTDEAVKSMLPKGGRVICELSGGLDSTTVLSTAIKFDPAVQALSLTRSSKTAGDDDRYSKEVAARYGVRRHEIDADLFPHFSAMPNRFAAEPGGEMHVAIRAAYDELLVQENIDVVLTGDPGDIVFGYGGLSPVHLADSLYRFRPLQAIKSTRLWAAHADVERPWTHLFVSHALYSAWRHWRRQSLIGNVRLETPKWISNDFLKRTGVIGAVRAQVAPRVAFPGQQYLWEGIYDMAAQVTDSSRLSSPAEVRHPLFHRQLVEFMLNLDPELRQGVGGDRVLQRHALADRLPESVRTRLTKGSSQQAKERALLTNETWYRSLTENSRLIDRGWVEPREWRQQIDRARLGLYGKRPNIDIAMLTEWWLRTIENHKPPTPPQLYPAKSAG